MGIVSLIFWALILIVGLKYAILILRADNHGEGGIVALLALLDARHAPRGSCARVSARRRPDRGRAALWRWRDYAGDLGAQRRRRPENRRTCARAAGRPRHDCDPDRSVPGPAEGNRLRWQHLRPGHAGVVCRDRLARHQGNPAEPGHPCSHQPASRRALPCPCGTGHRLCGAGRRLSDADGRRGDVRRHGPFWPAAHPARMVRDRLAGPDAQLSRPGRPAPG